MFRIMSLGDNCAMEGLISQIVVVLAGTAAVGAIAGWFLNSSRSNRRINAANDSWQDKLDVVSRQRDTLTNEAGKLRSTIENQQELMHKHETAVARGRTEIESAHERIKSLTKDVFTLRAEREDFKTKVLQFQNTLMSFKQRAEELEHEFIKSGDFYKSQLQKSFEKRKDLESKLENARLEHESFSNLLNSSRSEQESINKMLESARTRLDNLDKLEQDVIGLEAENAQLKHDAAGKRLEIETLHRDVAELEELKVQNKELAHCLKSMENSRQQYEEDANRYRAHAGESEQKSETLKIRLDEVEKNFADMEKQQRKALVEARQTATVEASNDQSHEPQEVDDLKDIVGIGKVFERTLHDLGIVSFRQIANFGVGDIARVNSELKEFKGRMEQDDWIGQAKDLLFKKYGQTG